MRSHIVFSVLLFLSSTVLAQSGFNDSSQILISCDTLEGLKEGLDEVSNEIQIFNNDEAIWSSKDGCTITPKRPFTIEFETARTMGVAIERASRIGQIGWIVTDNWLVPVQRILYLDNGTVAYRPAGIWSVGSYSLSPDCKAMTHKVDGVTLFRHQHTEEAANSTAMAHMCASPVAGSEEEVEQAHRCYKLKKNLACGDPKEKVAVEETLE